LFLTYIQWKRKVGVEAGEQNEQSCDKVVDGRSPRVWRNSQRNDADDRSESSTDVLKLK